VDSDSSAELDITQELADLDLSTDHDTAYSDDAGPPPAHLRGLLDECGQTTPHEFSAFIETFPFDPVLQSSASAPASRPNPRKQSASGHMLQFRKIGEASYSEVFGIGDVVLKIVPIRDEDTSVTTTATEQAETPAPSDAADVLREIASTRAMGEISDGGFVRLLRSYIVRGRYPSLLLALWDDYDERKGSESVRPGKQRGETCCLVTDSWPRRLCCVPDVRDHCPPQRRAGPGVFHFPACG
jgi:serine/threonine-protein kinase haspin